MASRGILDKDPAVITKDEFKRGFVITNAIQNIGPDLSTKLFLNFTIDTLPAENALNCQRQDYTRQKGKSRLILETRALDQDSPGTLSLFCNKYGSFTPDGDFTGSCIRKDFICRGETGDLEKIWQDWIPPQGRIPELGLAFGVTLSRNDKDACEGLHANIGKLWAINLLISGEKDWIFFPSDSKGKINNHPLLQSVCPAAHLVTCHSKCRSIWLGGRTFDELNGIRFKQKSGSVILVAPGVTYASVSKIDSVSIDYSFSDSYWATIRDQVEDLCQCNINSGIGLVLEEMKQNEEEMSLCEGMTRNRHSLNINTDSKSKETEFIPSEEETMSCDNFPGNSARVAELEENRLVDLDIDTEEQFPTPQEGHHLTEDGLSNSAASCPVTAPNSSSHQDQSSEINNPGLQSSTKMGRIRGIKRTYAMEEMEAEGVATKTLLPNVRPSLSDSSGDDDDETRIISAKKSRVVKVNRRAKRKQSRQCRINDADLADDPDPRNYGKDKKDALGRRTCRKCNVTLSDKSYNGHVSEFRCDFFRFKCPCNPTKIYKKNQWAKTHYRFIKDTKRYEIRCDTLKELIHGRDETARRDMTKFIINFDKYKRKDSVSK